MTHNESNEIKLVIELLEKEVKDSISIFHLLIILESWLSKLEENLTPQEIEAVLTSSQVLAQQLQRLSFCKVDVHLKAITKDPRLIKLRNYLNVLTSILQKACGIQTTQASITSAEVMLPTTLYTTISYKTGDLLRGRYMLIAIVGEGGMGVVWQAKDISQGVDVAIKIPRITGNPVKDEVNVRKINIEAEVLKNLNHPNIVRFIDFFVENNVPHLVMEYVRGLSLESLIKPDSVLDEKESKEFFKRLADAVDHIHSGNVVHRDLKPKNIVVVSTVENIKVLDFGTAKFFHSQLEFGEGIYSPGGYTAPEQLKFMYSPQSDIWSLGGILFYILTGLHPITVLPGYPNVSTPPQLERVPRLKDLDPRFAKVIRKAMDPDPVNRYLRASDMIKDLLGEKNLSENTKKPKIIVLGKEIEVDTDRIVIGRLTEDIRESLDISIEDDVAVIVEEDNTYIYINDRNAYISRQHAEIFKQRKRWYLRDLGSLNKTAVLINGQWVVVYKAYKQPSQPLEIGTRAIIAIGYNEKYGPYITIMFIAPE
jgi:serine/threonine protein kinase